jgi:threonine/homoserine/homoserine lactone efflux protein
MNARKNAAVLGLSASTTTPSRKARSVPIGPIGAKRAFREGVLVEALNPKTAAFFLAFIPQFLDPTAGYPAIQFIAMGLTSMALNTFADVIVVMLAAKARATLLRKPIFIQRVRQGSGLFIAALGVSLALARRPAAA